MAFEPRFEKTFVLLFSRMKEKTFFLANKTCFFERVKISIFMEENSLYKVLNSDKCDNMIIGNPQGGN